MRDYEIVSSGYYTELGYRIQNMEKEIARLGRKKHKTEDETMRLIQLRLWVRDLRLMRGLPL